MTIKSQQQERNRKVLLMADEKGLERGYYFETAEEIDTLTSQTIDTLCDEIGKRLPDGGNLNSGLESDALRGEITGKNSYRRQVLQLLKDIKQGKI